MRRSATLALLALTLLGAMGLGATPQSTERSSLDATHHTDDRSIRVPIDAARPRDALWTPAIAVAGDPNTDDDEYEPRISADGTQLFLVRRRAGSNADLFVFRWTPTGWSVGTALDAVNSDRDELGPELAADGRTLLFYSDREGGLGGYDLWRSERDADGGWSLPTNLGPAINTAWNEYGPALTPDGRQLYFSSNRPRDAQANETGASQWRATLRERRGRMDHDIYRVDLGSVLQPIVGQDRARMTAGEEVEAGGSHAADADRRGQRSPQPIDSRGVLGQSLGRTDQSSAELVDALSTDADEGSPAVSPAGDFLYFASDRAGGVGGHDLYRVRLDPSGLPKAGWPIEPLGDAINSSSNELDPALGAEGFRIYFSSDRSGPERTYDLFTSTSREVYPHREIESPEALAASDAGGPALWPKLWQAIWPWLLLLLLLALLGLLLALLASRQRLWRDRLGTMGLLARCAILSLLLHLLIAALLAAWKVGGIVAERIGGSGHRILLSSAASADADTTALAAVEEQLRSEPTRTALAEHVMEPETLTQAITAPAPDATLPRNESIASAAPLEPMAAPAMPAASVSEMSITPVTTAHSVTEPAPELEPEPAPLRADAPRPPAAIAPTAVDEPARPSLIAAAPSSASEVPLPPTTPTSDQAALQEAIDAAASLSAPTISTAELGAIAAASSTRDATAPTATSTLAPDEASAAPEVIAPTLPQAPAPRTAPGPANAASIDAALDIAAMPALTTLAPSTLEAPSTPSARTAIPVAVPLPEATPPMPAPTAPSALTAPLAAQPPTTSSSSTAPLAAGAPIGSASAPRVPPAPPPLEDFAQRDPTVREDMLAATGGSDRTEEAVRKALEWLRRHQHADGHWSSRDHGGEVDADAAMTGLALLAFLGAGHTHRDDGPYRATIERGIAWLVERQAYDGDLRGQLADGRPHPRADTMYGQTIATVALCEAYAMTRDASLAPPARRAIDFVLAKADAAQRGTAATQDTAVIGWLVMTVESARRAGFDPPTRVFDGARRWLDDISAAPSRGRYAYRRGDRPSPAMTAEAMFVQQLLGRTADEPRMRESADFIADALPAWSSDAPTHHWYYATLALFQHQGEPWVRWNDALTEALLANQREDGPHAGSWDPQDRWSRAGGRVYQTAICALSLEVYYRYAVRDGAAPTGRTSPN